MAKYPTDVTSFAFYGRVPTEDNQDPESSRAWQLTAARVNRYRLGRVT